MAVKLDEARREVLVSRLQGFYQQEFDENLSAFRAEQALRNLSTTMGHSTGLIREQCPVW